MPWKVCHATAFEPEAHLVKGFLEHQGIPCLLESRRVQVDPLRATGLGTIRILVPEEWMPVAAKLISHRTRRRTRPRGEVIAVDFRRRRRVRAAAARRGSGGV
jgi:hypothetical protein